METQMEEDPHTRTEQDTTQAPQTKTTTGTMTDPCREWSPLEESPPKKMSSPKQQRSATRTQSRDAADTQTDIPQTKDTPPHQILARQYSIFEFLPQPKEH